MKQKSPNRKFCKRRGGFSILETLVSVVVMGIAIAGIAEMLWANTSWLTTLQNKFDSYYAAKRFLAQIESDLHQATSVSSSSDGKILSFSRADESNFDGHGFLTYSSQYVYFVDPDTEPGSEGTYVIKAGSNVASATTVLRGLVGPISITSGQPVVFQYLERTNSGLQPTAQSSNPLAPISISGVVVNLEIKRNEFGKSIQDGANKSGLAIRDEVFLRNSFLHAQ